MRSPPGERLSPLALWDQPPECPGSQRVRRLDRIATWKLGDVDSDD